MKGYKMKTKRENKGFTLVELLTVMSVIAILIGLLVPALNLVRKMAKDTSQKAQLHSIGVSLDMFNGENDGYPDSERKGTASGYTTGAQRLAEALVGRDMLGFDVKSTWDAYVDDTATVDIPYASATLSASPAEVTNSLNRRKGPYLNPEKVEAYNVGDTGGIGELYSGATGITNEVYKGIATQAPAPVLTDVYRVKGVTLANNKTIKAGSPILYYKANASLVGSGIFPNTQISTGGMTIVTTITDADAQSSIYNSMDNEDLIRLGDVATQTKQHHFDKLGNTFATPYTDPGGHNLRWVFYDTITNSKITTQPRPYNASTYLLISAGSDGIYGTTDDITNFGD
jgi:prepilin-type N-terminal cleavage/methylation domain-containing protein